jgi:hypothetical protein
VPEAKLTVHTPPDTWVTTVSESYPDAVFRVLRALPGRETASGLVELTSEDPVAILTALDGHAEVTAVDLLWKREETALLQIESSTVEPMAPAKAAGVPVRTPFRIQDGRAVWEVTASSERLRDFADRLEAADVRFAVSYVREEAAGDDQALTDRQREVLDAAAEMGYYETPRRATLTDVAASLDVSKSTASDVLHRAEGNLVDWVKSETTLLGRE